MPHSGYPDHQVKKTYNTYLKTVGRDKSMKIIGGDFNAELGPGEGVELSGVGITYTPNKANCRGEWLTQWVLENNLFVLNTMYKKLPQKQVTHHTPKLAENQLDYILTDKKHHSPRRMIQFTWEAITDVLWQSLRSRNRNPKANPDKARRQRSNSQVNCVAKSSSST